MGCVLPIARVANIGEGALGELWAGAHDLDVLYTVARARWGEGQPWGCTVIPLVGDALYAVQPQVSLTSGRVHTCAAPGAATGDGARGGPVPPRVCVGVRRQEEYMECGLERLVPMRVTLRR